MQRVVANVKWDIPCKRVMPQQVCVDGIFVAFVIDKWRRIKYQNGICVARVREGVPFQFKRDPRFVDTRVEGWQSTTGEI